MKTMKTPQTMTPALGNPVTKSKSRTVERMIVTPKQTLAAALIDWLGKLTLSGGGAWGPHLRLRLWSGNHCGLDTTQTFGGLE